MKRVVLLSFSVLCFHAHAWAQPVTVKATIDEGCTPRNTLFTVPAGQVASNFGPPALSSGTNCQTGGRVANPAWGISTADACRKGDVFYYNVNDNGRVTQTPVPLSALTLSAGRYCAHVDGGKGASVSFTFNLAPAGGRGPAAPSPACQLNGTWSVGFKEGNDQGKMTLALRQDGTRVSGTMRIEVSGMDAASGAISGSVSGPTLRLTAKNPQGDDGTIDGSVANECRELRVTFAMGGDKQSLTLVRQ